MKKALIITYYWPPSGGSGVQRWLYFAAYLQENGFEPVVITVDPEKAAYPSYDPTLLEKVKQVRVIHTAPGFSLFKAYSFMKSGKSKKVVPVGDVGGSKKTVFDKFSAWIRANYFIPDARVGWNSKVIPVADKLLEEETIDVVITTGPPHSTHLIALELKKKHAFHWLADFRDPWHDIYYNVIFKRTTWADQRDLRLERSVLQQADTILTVGPSMKKLLAAKEAGLEKKTFYVYNGYDSEAFKGMASERYPEFTIAHIGVWTPKQAHEEVIAALEALLEKHKNQTIRFVLAGMVQQEILERLQRIDRLVVDHKGKVPHRKALQEMMNADLLLNCLALLDNSEILISGKLMEYIATGNPIVVVGNKQGDAAQLLADIPDSHVVSPGDAEGLQQILEKQMQKERLPASQNTIITQFSRQATTAELGKLLHLRLQITTQER